MEAIVSLTAAEIYRLCDLLNTAILATPDYTNPDVAAEDKALWTKLHGAAGQQIVAPEVKAAIEERYGKA